LTAINPRITTSTALYIIRPTPKPFFLIHLKKQTIGTNFSSLLLKEKSLIFINGIQQFLEKKKVYKFLYIFVYYVFFYIFVYYIPNVKSPYVGEI